MILFKQAKTLTDYLHKQQADGKTVGFVPTMGALHGGHLSLLRRAKKETDLAVCSIFVNPTQFNNPDDFRKYPVTVEQDLEQLIRHECDILFLPSREEIYPAGYRAQVYELGPLETVLEGAYRPGHFQGVCQVVDRLLEIVNPALVYLGQKDYQQCRVIQKLLCLTGRKDITLVISPTVREEDGLAMSSRNLRLTKEQREKAPALFRELRRCKNEVATKPFHQIKEEAIRHLSERGFRVDYFEIADGRTLQPATDLSQPLVALAAASVDDIRLIDNLPLN